MNLKYEVLDEIHATDLISIWSDEHVIRYTNIEVPCSLNEITERINFLKLFDVFIVRYKGDVIGVIGCPCIDKSQWQYGVFYQFKQTIWGQGCATQATKWLLNYMKKKYTNATFYADVVTENVASEKILKHFGFELISQEESSFERNGIKMTIRNYRL